MNLPQALLRKRLDDKLIITPGCWLYIGPFSPKGYGKIQIACYHLRAHRVAYEAYVGKIPEDLLVRHKCDNPRCCNPEHLELGTNADNMKDKKDRKRSASGENHGMAILSNIERSQIIDLLKCRLFSMRKIADAYGVSLGAINNIKYRHMQND